MSFAPSMSKTVSISKPMEKGWFSYVGTRKLDAKSQQSRADEFNKLVRESKERKEIIADLEDFIGQLKRRGITPVFVTAPCYPDYVARLDRKLLEQNRTDILRLAKNYHIAYWNCLNLRIPKEDFFNCDHLNARGAELFTMFLNKKLTDTFPENS